MSPVARVRTNTGSFARSLLIDSPKAQKLRFNSNGFQTYSTKEEMQSLDCSYIPENEREKLLASPQNNYRKLTESKTVMNR